MKKRSSAPVEVRNELPFPITRVVGPVGVPGGVIRSGGTNGS